jgi:hypothetical protein
MGCYQAYVAEQTARRAASGSRYRISMIHMVKAQL